MTTIDHTESAVDRVEPGDKWAFDASVTDAFDNMLARSIPQYPVMRDAVTNVGTRYIQPTGDIVDLGASRGVALMPFYQQFAATHRVRAIEVSAPMLDVLRSRFPADCVLPADLRHGFPTDLRPTLTLSVLTLQFVPIEYRQRLIRQIYQQTVPGGAFILVEKVLGNTAEIDAAMVELYYALKGENGYSPEAIERKRLSLEGVLVPVTARWNEELLTMAGFRQIDCFWRWMNFAGWIAIKE